jgi:hypothetical protein
MGAADTMAKSKRSILEHIFINKEPSLVAGLSILEHIFFIKSLL